ncbi:MAG TPA: C45 family peptidase, partial [Nocardioidaceae bacterium]|nr:C45 family peptidase [Nocardioidaceae bacterium]
MDQVRSFASSVLDPHERGVEFGERHRDEVTRTVAAYHRLFEARAIGPFDIEEWAERAWQVICGLAPVASQEIRGIADGAGLPVREIAALNARTELLAIANPTGVDECSTVVSLPPGRPPVAVQTWDWYDAMSENWLRWTIPHPDGRVVETVTEFGVLGKIGVNAYGVGVLLNMLHHTTDTTGQIGYPVHLLSRHILDTARDLDEAVAVARSVTTSASTSLTIVEGRSEGGRAVAVELFPDGPALHSPEDGLLVRTNHFVSEPARDGCLAATIGPGSELRRTKVLSALDGPAPTSADEVVAVMEDHAEVGGVCAHPDRSLEPVLQHATLATVAIDTVGHTLSVSSGGPCVRERALGSARAENAISP